jgi:Domain of unknown function (DUF4395)
MAAFFSFPNPVNHTAARLVATGVVAITAIALGTGALWLSAVLAYGFLARVAAGPRLSPLGFAASRLAPLVNPNAALVPGPPKRFAQSLGALFSLAAFGCYLAGEQTAAIVVLAVLLVPAVLEAAFGYCLGCEVFALLMRAGIVPESICLECADIYSARAQQRRLSRS